MLRYGFIAAGNIIRAMHRGAEMNKDYNPAEIGIYDINEEVRKDYAARGYEVFELVQEYYKTGNLYRENFPVQSGDGTYSFLWPYNCLTTGAAFLTDLEYDVDYKTLIDGLSYYWMESNGQHQVAGYGSSTDGTAGRADRFYDDNSIVGISLLEAYERLNDEAYLNRAGQIVDFLKSGKDDIFGGGIWWNESLKNVAGNESSNKPACANGYAVQFLLKYYEVCPQERKEEVLAFAKELYEWIKTNLRDNTDNCYWNSKDASVIWRSRFTSSSSPSANALASRRSTANSEPICRSRRKTTGL